MMRKCLTYILPNSLCLFLHIMQVSYTSWCWRSDLIQEMSYGSWQCSLLFSAELRALVWMCVSAQSWPTGTDWDWDPMDCSSPDSSVHGTSQIRILEWVAISYSCRSSWPRDWTLFSCGLLQWQSDSSPLCPREAPVCSKGTPIGAAWILCWNRMALSYVVAAGHLFGGVVL